jgi:hypothetical protein
MLDVVAHVYNPSTWEEEKGGPPLVKGQPRLHGDILSQKKKKKKDKSAGYSSTRL